MCRRWVSGFRGTGYQSNTRLPGGAELDAEAIRAYLLEEAVKLGTIEAPFSAESCEILDY